MMRRLRVMLGRIIVVREILVLGYLKMKKEI
jgi:hypothetical protein